MAACYSHPSEITIAIDWVDYASNACWGCASGVLSMVRVATSGRQRCRESTSSPSASAITRVALTLIQEAVRMPALLVAFVNYFAPILMVGRRRHARSSPPSPKISRSASRSNAASLV